MAWSDSVPHAYVYDWDGWSPVEGCQGVAHTDVDCAKSTLNYHRFGVLYNFSAVEQWDLCPNGWHVPTDEEWTAMTSSLGSEFFAGNMLKDYSWGGTNLSGFSGLPGGQVGWGGVYQDDGNEGFWWSSSPVGTSFWFGSSAWHRIIGHNGEEDVYRSADKPRRSGFYVRCVRDAE